MKLRTALGLAIILVLACTEAPAPRPKMTGTWTGSISSSASGSGTTTLALNEANGETVGLFSGTWTISYPSQPNASGSLTGLLDETSLNVTLNLTPSVTTQCPYKLTGVLKNYTSITGTYVALNCAVAESGSISVDKQP